MACVDGVVDGLGAVGGRRTGLTRRGRGVGGSGDRCDRRLISVPEEKHRDHSAKCEYHHDHEPGDEASAFDDRAVVFGGGDPSGSGIGCRVAPVLDLG